MQDELGALTTIFTEFYYWVTIVIMFLIHVGFCLYEVGASREKNTLNTLMKNAMLIPVITVACFFFGWWIYFALPTCPGITGGLDQGYNVGPSSWSNSHVPIYANGKRCILTMWRNKWRAEP